MYQFFAKMGYNKRQTEWFPILIVRIFLGVFFILSGFFKIFDAKQHATLLQTIKDAHIPLPEFNAYFVPFMELACGVLILVGLLTTLASFILFVIMITAIVTDRLASVTHHGGIIALENFLYLPEVLYGLMFLWLFFSGPGKISVDYKYGKSKRLSSY
ncbi:MAG: DoxX family protein [Simkaniaceae bacterium]|jgi:putative oxidoreductase|nr:MAG: DoxX family protein [Simkaniaceae bacterium]